MRFGASRLVRDRRGRVGFGPLVRVLFFLFFCSVKVQFPQAERILMCGGCL